MKVSWQVTGIRKDPWANAHRDCRLNKTSHDKERGRYMHPDLYGQPADKGTSSKAIIITRHHVL